MNILVAYDFTPAAGRALAWAANFQRSRGATLHVLNVLDPVPPMSAAVAAPLLEPDVVGTESALRRVLDAADATGTVQCVLSPLPGEAIVQVLQERQPDLVVVGTHGREGLTRVLLGSVAEYVIRHADVPVLTLRVAG
jgi:nucleotide-binding universal stress UspA family protein